MKVKIFSDWKPWISKNDLKGLGSPGVYCIAISKRDLSGISFDWIEDIKYVGMTNSKAGLKGRLTQFNNTIKGKQGHGGADRFKYKHQNYDVLVNKLYVSVCFFDCDVESNKPDDLRIMGEVAKFEFDCFAKYVSEHGKLPEFNDKKKARKYSLTFGRDNPPKNLPY